MESTENSPTSEGSVYAELFMSDRLSDVTFAIGKRKFPAHKLVLWQESDYFHTMFAGQLKESTENLIHLHLEEEDADVFQLILEYIYTKRMENENQLTITQMMRLVSMAHEYLMAKFLAKLEARIIVDFLKVETVLQLFTLAQLYNLAELKYRCLILLDSHAQHLAKTDEFANLNPNVIIELLRNRPASLTAIEIFELVLQQMKRETVSANQATKDNMANCIPLADLSATEFQKIIKPTGIFFDSDYVTALARRENEQSIKRGKISYLSNTVCVSCKRRTPKKVAEGDHRHKMMKLFNCGHILCSNCIYSAAEAGATCPSVGCEVSIRRLDLVTCGHYFNRFDDSDGDW